MRVIITGGTGLIGSALAESLANEGHEVVVLSRSPESKGVRLPAGARAVGWDARSSAGWGDLADGAGAIVNLAGANLAGGLWTKARKEVITSSRLQAGQAVVEAVQNARVKPGVVVQASAVGYYGSRGDEELREDAPPGDDFLARLCVAWEASTEAVEAMGVRRYVSRTGIVLHPAGPPLRPMLIPFRLGLGGRLGSGRQWTAWIHRADMVGALRHAIDSDEVAGPHNTVSPNPVTNAEFTSALGRALGRPTVFAVPAFVLRLVLGEMSQVLLDGQRAVPRRLEATGYRATWPDIDGALTDLLR